MHEACIIPNCLLEVVFVSPPHITILQVFADKGVQFELGQGAVKKIERFGNEVHVWLGAKTEPIVADVILVGIGVTPSTRYLRTAPVQMTDAGHVIVDARMRSTHDNIYACGDICVFPLRMCKNKHVNVQHWQMALKHGYRPFSNVLFSTFIQDVLQRRTLRRAN